MAKKSQRKDAPSIDEQADEVLQPDAQHGEDPLRFPSWAFFRQRMDRFTVAWLFLTRVPLPRWWNTPMPGEIVAPPSSDDKGVGMVQQ